MKQITSIDRDQIQFTSLEMMVGSESLVRVIDVFLDFACTHDLGFQNNRQVTGRPAFPTRTLLGIYIYGYLNRIRSSRALEKACVINIELMWLLKGHQPCYKTIANFRKDNRVAFGKLFKLYRSFCLRLDLYGKEVVAIDGSKFRAQNSMKNNYNEKKIGRHLEYIEKKEQEYLDTLDAEDKDISGFRDDRYTIKNSICKLCEHYEQCVSKCNHKSSQGRYIDRYLTDKAVQWNKTNSPAFFTSSEENFLSNLL